MTGMVDAWEIGVNLVLNDAITGQIAGVEAQFNAVQQAVDRVNASLKQLPASIKDVRSAASGLSSSFTAAANAAERIQAAMRGSSFGGGAGGGGAGGGGGGTPLMIAGPEPASGGGGGSMIPVTDGGGGGGREPPNWRYNQGPDVPFIPPKTPSGGDSGGGGSNFDVAKMAGQYFLGRAVADGVWSTLKLIFTAPFDIEDQKAQIKAMTPEGQNSDDIVKQAYQIATQIRIQNPGVTQGQALGGVIDLFSIDRNMKDVSDLSKDYSRDAFIMSKVPGGEDAWNEGYSALRAAEEAGKFNGPDGKFDPKKAVSFMDLYTKLIVSSGGRLDAAGALDMIGQGGAGFTQMDDKALAQTALMAAVLGASKTGTGVNALYQEFIGGKMAQGTARQLHAEGVLNDTMVYTQSDVGKTIDGYKVKEKDVGDVRKEDRWGMGYVHIPPGALPDQQDFLKNPYAWLQKHIFHDYLNSDGSLKSNTPSDVVQMISDLNVDFSRIPGGRLASLVEFNAITQARQLQNAGDLKSLDDLHTIYSNTPNSQGGAVKAALSAASAQAASGTADNWLTRQFKGFSIGTDYLIDHPWDGIKKIFQQDIWTDRHDKDDPLGTILQENSAIKNAVDGVIVSALHEIFLNDLGQLIRDLLAAINGQPGKDSNHPMYTKQVGQPGAPTMPTGPTTPPASVSMPNPGKQLVR